MRRFAVAGLVGVISYFFGTVSSKTTIDNLSPLVNTLSEITNESTEMIQQQHLNVVPNPNNIMLEVVPATSLELVPKETSSSHNWYKTVSYSFVLALSLNVGSSLLRNIMKNIRKQNKINVPIIISESYGKECYDHSLLLEELNSKMRDSKFSFSLCQSPLDVPHLECCFYLKDSRDEKTPFDNSILYVVTSTIENSVNRPHMFMYAHSTTNLELKNEQNLINYLELNFVH